MCLNETFVFSVIVLNSPRISYQLEANIDDCSSRSLGERRSKWKSPRKSCFIFVICAKLREKNVLCRFRLTVILLGTLVYVGAVFYVLYHMHTTKQHGCFEKYLKDKKAVQSDLINRYDFSSLSPDECNGIVNIFRHKSSKEYRADVLLSSTNSNYTNCLIQQYEKGEKFDATLLLQLYKEIGDAKLIEDARRKLVEIEIDSTRACEHLNL